MPWYEVIFGQYVEADSGDDALLKARCNLAGSTLAELDEYVDVLREVPEP